jgi:hypothetical protein
MVAFGVSGLALTAQTAQVIRSMIKYYNGTCTGQDINNNTIVTAFSGSNSVANLAQPSLGGPFFSRIVEADISIFQFPAGFQYARVSVSDFPYTTLVWTAGPNGAHGKNTFMNGTFAPITKASLLYFDLVCNNNGAPWQAYVTIWYIPWLYHNLWLYKPVVSKHGDKWNAKLLLVFFSGIGLSAPIATAQQVFSMDAYYAGNCTGSDINPPDTKSISAFFGPGIPGTKIIGADISIFKLPQGLQYAEVSVQNPSDTAPNYLAWAAGPIDVHAHNMFPGGVYASMTPSSVFNFDLVCDNNGNAWQGIRDDLVPTVNLWDAG